MTTTTAPEQRGHSYTTSTVHRAQPSGPQGQLQQMCGMGRKQAAYLYPTEAAVTCKRCEALPEGTTR